jgi:predicted secreted protein
MKRLLIGSIGLMALATAPAWAADLAAPAVPTVSVTAAATASVANDRMFASLRAEVDNADPARAAAEVNARIGKAIARVKSTPAVEVKTSGYSSYQFTDKLATRWRVQQSISLESSDFAALAALLTRMQSEDTLVMSGMSFGVSNEARRKAEDALTQEAIKSWQARAQSASKALGFDAWRVGRVNVMTGEPPMRPQAMMRMQAAAGAGAPPVNAEGGNTDITVTVTGDAMLVK